MALDRQRILGELGSVMKQLQNADCGCLGKLFGNGQQATPMMGSPLSTCGGCRRSCCHGHGYGQYNSSMPNNQSISNMNYMPMEGTNNSNQPMSGSMHGFGPQIVNMMKSNHLKSQNVAGQPQEQILGQMSGQMPGQMSGQIPAQMPGQTQGQMLGQIQGQMLGQMPAQMPGQTQGQMPGQLTGPIVIDAPQSPHGKVGLRPFTPPSMIQQPYINPPNMNQGDNPGNMQSQFNFQPNVNADTGNVANTNWAQQYTSSNPVAHHTSPSHLHGKHSEGMAKFNQMFPGVKQGIGGDLGFDPMAIAIQMNPDNHLHSAMDSMHKIMNGNRGIDQVLNKPPEMQNEVVGNMMQQSSPVTNGMTQQSPVVQYSAPGNADQIYNQIPMGQNKIANQLISYQQNTNPQQIPQQSQQIYAAAVNPNAVHQQQRYEANQQLTNQQQYEQRVMDMNSSAPNLPVLYEGTAEGSQEALPSEPNGYPNQVPAQQTTKEPIFPVDTSKNQIYIPTKNQKYSNYGYNTLGQPVEMLPAKMYHPPEPALPQTLSPQPVPVKSKIVNNLQPKANVKATVSKTSLMGNKPVGKTPSRSQLQHIYNQYKGSQSFTQQNVQRPGEGTYSAGRLNIPQPTKAPAVPVERVGGDTIVNNPPSNEERMNKVENVMGQIGDVPAAKPGGDTFPVKESPVPVRKCRNGLQDVVFSSYPTSAAWTFHGYRHNELSPTRRYQNRRY